MALTFPFPLAFLSDIIRGSQITTTLRRFDEESGSASGRVWASEMAPPLWVSQITLTAIRTWAAARGIEAKIRALGANGTMLFADPTYGPAGGDPGASVTVGSVSSDRSQISLSGLPANFALAPGDRLSINVSGRYWMTEIGEAKTATGAGNTSLFAVYPYVPTGVTAGAAVEMRKPVCKMRVEGFTPFTMLPGDIAQGASLSLTQKI